MDLVTSSTDCSSVFNYLSKLIQRQFKKLKATRWFKKLILKTPYYLIIPQHTLPLDALHRFQGFNLLTSWRKTRVSLNSGSSSV